MKVLVDPAGHIDSHVGGPSAFPEEHAVLELLLTDLCPMRGWDGRKHPGIRFHSC